MFGFALVVAVEAAAVGDPTGWLMHHRRLARDYETHPHRSAAMIQLAAINLMTRRLTHEATPNWRDS